MFDQCDNMIINLIECIHIINRISKTNITLSSKKTKKEIYNLYKINLTLSHPAALEKNK